MSVVIDLKTRKPIERELPQTTEQVMAETRRALQEFWLRNGYWTNDKPPPGAA